MGGESEQFRIESWLRQRYIMFPWVFNVYMDAVIREVKMGMGRRGVRFLEGGIEWRLRDLLHADDLVLCGKSRKDLRAMVERFVEVCKTRGSKSMQVRAR